MLGLFGALWGLAGVLMLLGSAAYRLTPLALQAMQGGLHWHQWMSLAVITGFMAYAEGYLGFQKGFSPRVAARAKYLREHPRPLHVALAPLFCMGYFFATPRRKLASISLTLGIIVLILLVRLLSQPWRGIIDAGVVVGLAWGIVTLVIQSWIALTSTHFAASPETPQG